RSSFPRARAESVVVGQTNNLQARHFTFAFETPHFFDESLRSFHIRILHIPAPKPRIKMSLQSRDGRRRRVARVFAVVDKFPIAAIAHVRLASPIPKITFSGKSNREMAFRWIG